MTLFCELKDQYTSVSQLLQTLQFSHREGKKLRTQILHHEKQNSTHGAQPCQDPSIPKAQCHKRANELLSYQPKVNRSGSQSKEMDPKRKNSHDLQNMSSREHSRASEADVSQHPKGSLIFMKVSSIVFIQGSNKSALSSHEVSTNQDIGLNNSLQSQSVKNQSKVNQSNNYENSMRSEFIEEAPSANVTQQSINQANHGDNCAERSRRDSASNSIRSEPREKPTQMREVSALNAESNGQEHTKDELPLQAANYPTHFVTSQDAKPFRPPSPKACEECKQKDQTIEALKEQIQVMNDDNNKLTSNVRMVIDYILWAYTILSTSKIGARSLSNSRSTKRII